MATRTRSIFTTALVALLAGCVGTPTIDTSPSAKRSFDGLYPFEHTVFDHVWGRADLDLARYTQVMIEGAGIAYRDVEPSANPQSAFRRGETEFHIPAEARARFAELVREAFTEELRELEHWDIVTKPGPNTLLVRGALIDVVSHVPAERSGRGNVYISSVGEATLVLELMDSQSEAVLIRAVDRGVAQRMGGNAMTRANSVTNWADAKRMATFWASRLRASLDSIGTDLRLNPDA